MKAKSIKGASPEEIQNALKQSMDNDFAPTLAIVFISVKQDRKALCDMLKAEKLDIIGATSCHEFTHGSQSKGGIAVMLFEIDKNDYTILFEQIGDRTIADAATHLAQAALQKFSKPAFIICSTSVRPDDPVGRGNRTEFTIQLHLV